MKKLSKTWKEALLSDPRENGLVDREPIQNIGERWIQLPSDILISIATKLPKEDCARLATACKSWRRWVLSWRANMLLGRPTLVQMGGGDHPSSLRLISLESRSSVRYSVPMAETFQRVEILCGNFGWLLMSRGSRGLFFFNPLTGEKIEIPRLPRFDVYGFCFTSSPTSSECIVLGVRTCLFGHGGLFVFYHLRRGDTEWREAKVDESDPNAGFTEYGDPVFHKGVFYMMGTCGDFVVYDPRKNRARFLGKPKLPCHFMRGVYLLESEEALVSLFFKSDSSDEGVKVFRLDETSMAWKETNTLNHKVLIPNKGATLVTDSREMPELSGLEDGIYFPGWYATFLSLKTEKDQSSKNCMIRDFCNRRVKYESCARSGGNGICVLIRPSDKQHSKQELNW